MKRWITPWVLAAAVAHAGDLPTRMEMRDLALPVRVVGTPSGLRIIAEQDRSAPRAAVVIVVDAGGANDPPGKEGLAHLVEHLAFRAKLDGKHPYTDLLDLAGAGSWNAFTSHDVTAYYSAVAPGALPSLLKLETTRVLDPLRGVDAAAFDVEREVVRNELRQRDEQGRVSGVATELAAALFPPGHRYARPVIGTESSLSSLTLESAQAFAREHYVPHRMTLVVAGDLDVTQIGKLLDESLPRELLVDAPPGAISATPRIANPPPLPDVPPGPRLRRIRGPGDLPTLHIGWSLPQGFGKDGYLEQFAATVLGAAAGVAFKDEEILSISAALDRQKFASTLTLSVSLATGKDPEGSLERVLDQVHLVWASGATDAVQGARSSRFLLNHLQRFAAVRLAAQSESVLDRSVSRALFTHLTSDPAFLRKELAAIIALEAGQIDSFAFRWFDRGRARAVFVEPHGPIPTAGAIPPVFASVSTLRLSVPPGFLGARVIAPGATTKALRLPNGLEVVLARRPAAPVVAVTLTSRGGHADAEPLGAAEVGQLAWLHDDRDWFGTSIGVLPSTWTARASRGIQFESANGNLENALAMLRKAVDSLRVGDSTRYAWDTKERFVRFFALPQSRAERDIRQAVYRDTPLARTATPQDVERVSGQATNEWIERTLTPQNSILVVSGDVDLAQAEGALGRWLGDWKRSGPPLGPLPLPTPKPAEPSRILKSPRPGAQQTELSIGCAVPIRTEADLAAAGVLGEDLRMRLHQLARSALGATYGFESTVRLERGVADLRIQGSVDDRGLARILALARRAVETLGTEPLPAERFELARWRHGIRFTGILEHADALGRTLAAYRLSGLPADTLERYPATLEAMGPEQVGQVGAACGRTAVLQLLGEPATLERAVGSSGG